MVRKTPVTGCLYFVQANIHAKGQKPCRARPYHGRSGCRHAKSAISRQDSSGTCHSAGPPCTDRPATTQGLLAWNATSETPLSLYMQLANANRSGSRLYDLIDTHHMVAGVGQPGMQGQTSFPPKAAAGVPGNSPKPPFPRDLRTAGRGKWHAAIP